MNSIESGTTTNGRDRTALGGRDVRCCMRRMPADPAAIPDTPSPERRAVDTVRRSRRHLRLARGRQAGHLAAGLRAATGTTGRS